MCVCVPCAQAQLAQARVLRSVLEALERLRGAGLGPEAAPGGGK
jgi:hypothetical protein